MNKKSPQKFVLTVSCPETNGIARAVSDFLYWQGATIHEAALLLLSLSCLASPYSGTWCPDA